MCVYAYFQEKLLSQSQWKDYSSQPPPYAHYSHDGYEHDDPKAGWGGGSVPRHTYERQQAAARANTHSLPRGGNHHHQQAYPMGYSSYDRRAGGGFAPRGPADYPPDHYFMPSQRKYSGEVVRVYVDYNK